MVEKLLPRSITAVAKIQVDNRAAFGFDWLVDQPHVGMGWGAIAFFHVAVQTSADQIFPRGGPIQAARNDVIDA